MKLCSSWLGWGFGLNWIVVELLIITEEFETQLKMLSVLALFENPAVHENE